MQWHLIEVEDKVIKLMGYGPELPQGEALPELLTTNVLLNAIDRASIHDYNRKSADSKSR